MLSLTEIKKAQNRLQGRVKRTPILYSQSVADVYIKAENLQTTGSFKFRGASNKIWSLQEKGLSAQGVITASSGNHGQAVAKAAALAGFTCTVVVPLDAVAVKLAAIEAFGATIVRSGYTSEERIATAQELAIAHQWTYVPPYDDEEVMAGQGTVGLEMLEDLPELTALYVPLGGGGLLAGVATAIKETRPSVRVIGVEPRLANDAFLSLREGRRVDIGRSLTIADGLRTNMPGELTFPILQHHVDDVVLVEEDEIKEVLKLLLLRAKTLCEPSGAVALAAARKERSRYTGQVASVISGGNIDPLVLSRILAE